MKQLLSIIILLFCSTNTLLAEKMRIAIVNFNADGIPEATARKVSELIRTEIIKTKEFTVIERDQMNKILKEQGFQQTGCTDVSCAVEIGKMLSARKILLGTVMKLDNDTIITGRIVDVEKGVAEFSEDQNTRSTGIYQGAKYFAQKLTNRISGKTSSTSATTIRHYYDIPQKTDTRTNYNPSSAYKLRSGFGISYDFGYDVNGKLKLSPGSDTYNVKNNYLMSIEMQYTFFSLFSIGAGYSYALTKSFEDYKGTFIMMPYYAFAKFYVLKYFFSPYVFAQGGKVLLIPDTDFKGNNSVEGKYYYGFGAGIELGYLRLQALYEKSIFSYGNNDNASYSSIAISFGYIFHY